MENKNSVLQKNAEKYIQPPSEPYAPNIGKKMPQSAGAETSPRTTRSP